MRFPLATKLTVTYVVVAVVPIVAVAVVAQRLVEARYRAEFKASLDTAERGVKEGYADAADNVKATVAGVATRENPVVGQVLLDLAKGGLDEERQRSLVQRAPAEMHALRLDAWELLTDDGTVLAAGHDRGRAGAVDEAARARARRHPGRAVLAVERVANRGYQRDALMIEVAQPVQNEDARVILVGGRELSSAFLDHLKLHARLLAPDGTQLAVGSLGFPTAKPYPRRVIPLPGDDPAARVEVAVSDEDLGRALSWIRLAAVAVSVGGFALALLLGALVARRIARPLAALADGAHRVAAGDLGVTVDVRTRDEVGDLAATFNAMTADLLEARERLVHAERVAAWREIARRIAHEIKNPLTPIQMAMETMQRVRRGKPELFDEIFDESSRTILEEVARLKHIVAEFSGFARMPEPKLAPVAVHELVEGALALYAGGEVSIARDLAPATVRGDRDQLQQVLLNLLENARDAVAQAGRGDIAVRTRRAGDRVEIEVADSGPGISEEARARLFTPYFTTKKQGTGLGLAIVHRIVTDHGGEIRVGANEGGGAVFVVALPAA